MNILFNFFRAGFVVIALVAEYVGGTPAWRDGVQGACLVAGFLISIPMRGRVADLPFPRGNVRAYCIIGAIAVAVALTTAGIPYVSDDFVTLERARRAATPLQWVDPGYPTIGGFFRPFAWWHWWVVEHAFGGSLLAARLISTCWFAINAILIMPALRRAGVPRGIAFASAILFITNPIGVTTIAWLSNFYSQVSLGCMLAAIATLPYRKLTKTNWIPCFIFSFLAGVSKEDALLLPCLIFGIATRFKILEWRQWRRAFLSTLPAAAAIGSMLILRYALIGGIGGYNTGQFDIYRIENWLRGWREAFYYDFPSRYWMTARMSSVVELTSERGYQFWCAGVAVAATLLFASGIGRAGARRVFPLVFLIGGIAFVPVAGMLSLKDDLETIRLLYLPEFGFAAMFAALIAALPLRARFRWAGIVILSIVGIAVGQMNIHANVESGDGHRKAVAQFAEVSRTLPPKSRVYFDRLHRAYRGCLFFGGGFPWSFAYSANRYDLDLQALPFGKTYQFEKAYSFDFDRKELVDALQFGPSIELGPGANLEMDFVNKPEDRGNFSVYECSSFDWKEREWALWANQAEGSIFMKTLVLSAPCKVKWTIDAVFSEFPKDPDVTLLYKNGELYQFQMAGTKGEVVLPAGANRLRISLHPGLYAGHLLIIKSMKIQVEKSPG
ncbi:MAG: hypothetical protein HY286_18920 [Planctomycetes bacterium]|nr:hypothetical protein [Planctomycetota bacterium]